MPTKIVAAVSQRNGTTMERRAQIDWLLSAAGPILKYRTARDLLPDCPKKRMDALRRDLLESPEVRVWLERLRKCTHMHNGTNDRFENIMGRLTDFGLDRTFPDLDRRLSRFRRMLADRSAREKGGMMPTLDSAILALGLARAGYTDDPVVVRVARRRFAEVCQATRKMSFDVFYPEDQEPKKPRHFAGKRVVRREYAPAGRFVLPYIYDVHLAAALPPGALGPESDAHVARILDYVFHPDYQRLPENYGILIDDHGDTTKYYAVGWNVSLPGYDGGQLSRRGAKTLLLRLETMAAFDRARRTEWFRRSLDRLRSFRQQDGTYLLPSGYLCRAREGYWITGNHMHLQTKGAPKTARAMDSTFRMLLLEKRCA